MEVFMVVHYEHMEGATVYGLFSTYEKAEAFRNKEADHAVVEKMEVK